MPPVDLSEERDRLLIGRIAERDRDAFRDLFRRYAPTAMALARRVTRQPHVAEEMVQEAFLSVWKNPRGYEPARGTVRAWLMSTVHHRAVDAVRREEAQRRRAEDVLSLVDAAPEDPGETVVDALGLPEVRAAVRSALEDLPQEQRQVIELMYFSGKSQSRIARELGLPLGTVKSRTLLGMRRLRAALVELRR